MNRPHAPKHAPRVPFAILVTALIVGGMCALLGLNTASAANELARHNLAVKDADIAARVQELQNEVAASAAPGALGSAAAQLGMVPAGNPAFLEIGVNGHVRLLGSPAPASGAPSSAPKPKTSATATKAATSKPTSTTAASKTTSTTGKPTSTAHSTAKSTPPPTPTPTPTPTTTLPGGPR
ncbi:MAG TPA: hypothetical protein VGN35_03440 [Jatrophihabitantaceae bacterium]|jgi:cell division septation protein DedD|nr:hypothetical protein [Jatrophihabitantaceae bacterium]